MDGFTRPRHYG